MIKDKKLVALCTYRIYDPGEFAFITELNRLFRENNCALFIYALNSEIGNSGNDVAEAAVVDLQRAHAGGVRHLLRVHAGLDIHVHLADLQLALEHIDQPDQQRRLAAARRGHHVDEERAVLRHHPADRVRFPVVGRKDALFDLDHPYAHDN